MSAAPAATNAMNVLKELARHPTPQSATSISRSLQLPRASVYRLLSALEEGGFVRHLSEKQQWTLGIGVYELGSAYTRQAPLQRLARTAMTRLADRTQECAHLAVLHGTDVMYIIEERPLGRPPLVSDVGVRLPAVVTATGMSMLAALPPQQVRALFPNAEAIVRRNGHGPSSLPQLRSILSSVRTQGFAHEVDSVTPGFESIAMPVLDTHDLPVASVGVTWASARKDSPDEAGRAKLHSTIAETVRHLEERLGRRPA